MSQNKEIRDCRYCEYSNACDPQDKHGLLCYYDIGEMINNPVKDALECKFFDYCDIFPKN